MAEVFYGGAYYVPDLGRFLKLQEINSERCTFIHLDKERDLIFRLIRETSKAHEHFAFLSAYRVLARVGAHPRKIKVYQIFERDVAKGQLVVESQGGEFFINGSATEILLIGLDEYNQDGEITIRDIILADHLLYFDRHPNLVAIESPPKIPDSGLLTPEHLVDRGG